jgi:DNA (cytosine-5)-methyltransferase 1
MENVRGLHSMSILPKSTLKKVTASEKTSPGSLLRHIFTKFEGIGYRLDCFIINAVNYGAPQLRERLICIGNRYNLHAVFRSPEYSNRAADGLPPFKTLGDAIGDGFIDPDTDCMNFSLRKLRYLAMIPPGGNWRSMPVEMQKESMGKAWHLKGGRSAYWRKLSFDFPSPTVVTMPNHAGTSMCHPIELRALTVGECAAIQEFPAEWKFIGSPSDKCRQIGNAVPVRLAAVAGKCVLDLLRRIALLNEEPLPPHPDHSKIYHLRPHVRTRAFWKNGEVFVGNKDYYHD